MRKTSSSPSLFAKFLSAAGALSFLFIFTSLAIAVPQRGSLLPASSSLNFGNVVSGGTTSLTERLTNTGRRGISISAAYVTGSGFAISGVTFPLSIGPGQSAAIQVTFSPTGTTTYAGTLVVNSNASNQNLSVSLSGRGVLPGTLSPSAASLGFGNVTVGSLQSATETVTNIGYYNVTISQISSSNNQFAVSGITLPITLAQGQSAAFIVGFDPTVAGLNTGAIQLSSNAANPTLNVPVSGTGVASGSVSPSPTALTFGNVVTGGSQTMPASITNVGSTSVTVSGLTASGAGYGVSGVALPFTLNAGQSASFSVTFAPSATGTASGNVTIASNGANSTVNMPLSGTGVQNGNVTSSPSSLSFGNVVSGTSKTMSASITNSGGTSVTVSQVAPSGSGFSVSGLSLPLTLNAGQSAAFSVAFGPTTTGAASGSVTITSNGTNPTATVALSATGVQPGTLASSPASISFGNVSTGTTQTISGSVTNTGYSNVTISQVAASGTGFAVSGITLPVTLSNGQSANFSVAFDPTVAGSASGAVTITSNASNPTVNVALSGSGVNTVGTLTVTPTSMNAGSVVVGSSTTVSGTLAATGASVTVSSAVSNNSGVFSVGGLTLPATIPAGSSAPFIVTFSPNTAGSASAALTITSNASNASTTVGVTGTGTAPPTHSVNLSWVASTSTDVAGYNVYRAPYSTACGQFSMINQGLNSTTTFTDTTVTDGAAYCYAATAVDTSNNQSSYSNIVTGLVIPTT